MKRLGLVYRIFLQVLCLPVFLSDYFAAETGREYGIGFGRKLGLALRMIWNNTRIVSGSTFIEHLMMATALFRVPKSVPGCVVECGTYKGVSAANLSLACRLAGRALEVFDSFQGLPEPDETDRAHVLVATGEIHTYARGAWCGSFDEVKRNLARYGAIERCTFHRGFFEETLPKFDRPAVLVWVDVDFRSSLETCVRRLWPLLADGCPFFTHEAQHMEIASLFFSESWWKNELGAEPPGLIGAGTGLGFKILTEPYFNSSLGYTVKNPDKEAFLPVPQIGGMKLSLGAPAKIAAKTPAKAGAGEGA